MFEGLGASLNPKALIDKVGLDSSGPASALSSIGGAISGGLGSVGSVLKKIAGPAAKLPLPNPLHSYASYNYSLAISVLTTADYNNPDTTYMLGGKKLNLICKSGSADPSNRVNTAYGKQDFYIDNLEIDSLIGNEKGNNTNVTKMRFDITEPYSMGVFMISVQQAAREAGHPNWHDAPFLLTIQFRGNSQTGSMVNVPNTTRYIPFMFTGVNSKVTGAGAVYNCEALPYNAVALNNNHATLKTDVAISGKSVQELLQTGEKSLQAALNARAKKAVADGAVKVADEYLILFPSEIASAPKDAGKTEKKSKATTKPTDEVISDEMLKKMGVTRDSKSGVLLQDAASCNALGRSEMDFSLANKGDASVGKESVVYDEKRNIYIRGNNVIDFAAGDFRFTQDSNVFNAINQVLLRSKFPTMTLDPTKLSKEGYKGWWKIETQVFIKEKTDNMKSTGKKPKIIVYRVIPYDVHISKVPAVNVQTPGFDELKKQAVKVYNYIYTGKNTDILRFNIEHNASYMNYMNSDGFRTQDAILVAEQSAAAAEQAKPKGLPEGAAPSKKAGVNPDGTAYTTTGTETDEKGGSGNDSLATRIARMFHDAVNRGTEMQTLNMDIVGDPYFIAHSGQGNYVSKPVPGVSNLNADGTVNYQSGEVDIIVNFRSPSDINQGSGLYNISRLEGTPQKNATTPVLGFSGLYQVVKLVSHFKTGMFTQTIEGLRRPGQENETKGGKDQSLNNKSPALTPEQQASAKKAHDAAIASGQPDDSAGLDAAIARQQAQGQPVPGRPRGGQ